MHCLIGDMKPLNKAVNMVGGQAALARALQNRRHCNIRQQHIWKWLQKGRVPAEYAMTIEGITGGAVTRYDLRPDVFGPPPTPSNVNQEHTA